MSRQFYQIVGTLAFFLTFAAIYAQNEIPVERVCLGCICEAASGCNTTVGCNGDVCGPFRITWAYWADAGKPTLEGGANTNEGAYANCVNNAICAGSTVQGYMNKYAQDCNGDGVINCDDFVRIHRNGRNGCTGPLDIKYENVYKLCMKTFG